MDYRDNRQRWAESHQVVHFHAGQWCTFTPALTWERARAGAREWNTIGGIAKLFVVCRKLAVGVAQAAISAV